MAEILSWAIPNADCGEFAMDKKQPPKQEIEQPEQHRDDDAPSTYLT
jgi:hypothetical protein